MANPLDKVLRVIRNDDCDNWFVVLWKDGAVHYDVDYSVVPELYWNMPRFRAAVDGIEKDGSRSKGELPVPRQV